jgi:hypothetical protein
LYDEPRTWENIAAICSAAAALGGKATMRTGMHVNVGGSKFDTTDPAEHNALLNMAAAYDDTLIRLAHNPASGPTHRGRHYCRYVEVPPGGFQTINHAQRSAGHYQALNMGHLSVNSRHGRSSRIEMRMWDGTLDPGRIQTAVTTSLAMTHLALSGVQPGQGPERAGTHRNTYGPRKLEGQAWTDATESFRRFAALMVRAGAGNTHQLKALTKMFAESRWQS